MEQLEEIAYDDSSPARLTPDQWARAVAHSHKVTTARTTPQDQKRMNQCLETYNDAGGLTQRANEAFMGWARATLDNQRMADFLSEAIKRIDEGDSADVPRIPPRTQTYHWDAAYELFASESADESVAGAFIFMLLATQEAACDLQTVRRN